MPCAAARMIPRSTLACESVRLRGLRAWTLEPHSLHGRGALPLIGPELHAPSIGPALKRGYKTAPGRITYNKCGVLITLF